MDAEREIPKEDDFQNETRRLPLYWPEDEAGEVHSALGRESSVCKALGREGRLLGHLQGFCKLASDRF